MAQRLDRLHGFVAIWRRLARNEQVVLSLLAAVIGAAAAYGAIAFRALIGLVQLGVYGSASERLYGFAEGLAWWHVLLAPTVGGLVIGVFVHFVMPGRRNHGVADVIEAGALGDSRVGLRAGLGAVAAAATSIGFGASVGREGPVVHLGATLASWLARRLGFGRSTALTLLGCGVAAAVAASFNAPIAGVFFALEVVVGHYALAAFAPVVIASVTGSIIVRIHLGDFPAFIVPDYGIVSFLEIPAFLLLGLISAAVAGVFMWSTMFAEDCIGRTPLPPWSRPAFGGLAVGAIAVFFPQVLGVGYEATDLALKQAFPLWLLIALGVAKTAATAVSLGSGFAGGVFSPSLFIGAMVGGAFGIVAGGAFPELATSPGAYTIIGMAAVASAVLGAPISTILIVFELTGDYGITIAVMIASAVSSVVTQQVPGRSFFHWQLERRGIDIKRDRAASILKTITVREVMNETVQRIPRDISLDDIRELLRLDPHGVFFIVDGDGRLRASLTFDDLGVVAFEAGVGTLINAEDIARSDRTPALAGDSLERALALMSDNDVEFLPVIDDAENRRVIGLVRHKDIIVAHNRALLDAPTEQGGGL
ncbi:MAG: chloride channel protein [Alphaproteobacteria bacterium]